MPPLPARSRRYPSDVDARLSTGLTAKRAGKTRCGRCQPFRTGSLTAGQGRRGEPPFPQVGRVGSAMQAPRQVFMRTREPRSRSLPTPPPRCPRRLRRSSASRRRTRAFHGRHRRRSAARSARGRPTGDGAARPPCHPLRTAAPASSRAEFLTRRGELSPRRPFSSNTRVEADTTLRQHAVGALSWEDRSGEASRYEPRRQVWLSRCWSDTILPPRRRNQYRPRGHLIFLRLEPTGVSALTRGAQALSPVGAAIPAASPGPGCVLPVPGGPQQ